VTHSLRPRQTTYLPKRNTEARSPNHCRCGEAIITEL